MEIPSRDMAAMVIVKLYKGAWITMIFVQMTRKTTAQTGGHAFTYNRGKERICMHAKHHQNSDAKNTICITSLCMVI